MRTDRLASYGVVEGFGQTGRGTDADVNAVLGQQQDRTKHILRPTFDKTKQRIKGLVQRRTLRNHFQRPILADDKRFDAFSISDIVEKNRQAVRDGIDVIFKPTVAGWIVFLEFNGS